MHAKEKLYNFAIQQPIGYIKTKKIMNMKRHLLCMLLLIYPLFVNFLSAQNKSFQLDRGKRHTTQDYFEKMRGENFVYRFNIAYRSISLENPTFFLNKKNGDISYKGGATIGLSLNLYPVSLDIDGNYSAFQISDKLPLYDIPTGNKKARMVSNYGISGYISVYPMPDMGKISDIISPYIGIGYKMEVLSLGELGNSSKDKEKLASLSLNSPMWKVGSLLKFGGMGLFGEYRQSIKPSSPTNSREIVVGLFLAY